jgi:hypothetical protein
LIAVVDLTAIGLAAGTALLHSNSNQAFAKHAFVGGAIVHGTTDSQKISSSTGGSKNTNAL